MTSSHLSLTDIRDGYTGTVAQLRGDHSEVLRRTVALSLAYERRTNALILLADQAGTRRPLHTDYLIRLHGLLPWTPDADAVTALEGLVRLVEERYDASRYADAYPSREATERLADAEEAEHAAAIRMVRADDMAANR